ncbi:4-(cytidine 5'-diphospho)-2-C-methyl-D-erythritol kinase [Siphonobacter sp. SORGH_AS_0500]|uniref:4-(cytidine 5'-diphospho)-2-C-methyl-D-erythritol kinase n=1 Tax=Siphonobacter sp. SORGH_AS_0500 TaxID=1864824 RepID=UPI00285C3B3C|nr:4-(cytidine 5'-diphospho)-2-C-methyl-D-erythritol kinase [Siphonobacter sp. SORGH_AS_0500]MDR6196298.1 4-diphosphocytidyl-2-C-methyl-D-erythritol kinase [Siphonobacter sp. SORGH_AS_0500]
MISFPNAKINLGLYITEKRPDRFHNLESVFVPVGWTDVLEILPAEETSFRSSGIPIPGDASTNLCLKAYESLKEDFSLPPVWIHLHKVVPIGAGLGGGSSDAAFTLKMLNELFDLKLTNDQLEAYARPLGSDCAFFIRNEAKFCSGKGDEFSEIMLNLAGKSIILIYPNIHSSTAEAYASVTPKAAPTDWQEVLQQSVDTWKDVVHNDFETSLFPLYPTLEQLKQQLYEAGASYASMSGSGSTVFGIFDNDIPDGLGMGYTCWKGKL